LTKSCCGFTYTRTLLQISETGNRIDALLSSRVKQICNKMWIKSVSAPYCAIFLSLNSTSQAFGRMDSMRFVIKCLPVHISSRRQDNTNYLFFLSSLGKFRYNISNAVQFNCITLPFNASFKSLLRRSLNYKCKSTQNYVV